MFRCPRCGLRLNPRVDYLTLRHCPRCLGRGRLVEMIEMSRNSCSVSTVVSSPTLSVSIRTTGHRMTVSLAGEFDIASAPMVKATLHGLELKPVRQLVVDLRRVTFIDSVAVRVLRATDRYAREQGLDVRIVPGDAVARMLRILRPDVKRRQRKAHRPVISAEARGQVSVGETSIPSFPDVH